MFEKFSLIFRGFIANRIPFFLIFYCGRTREKLVISSLTSQAKPTAGNLEIQVSYELFLKDADKSETSSRMKKR